MKRRAITTNFQGPWTINDGRMSAPVVMLTPGVRCGSGGCLYYSANELQKCAKDWNGVPVTLDHPVNEIGIPISVKKVPDQIIGYVTDARFENNKLKATVNIMASRQLELSSKLQQMREVSTGLFHEDLIAHGFHGGERYEACAINIKPDHLALLTDARGACSWEDGCGIRHNASSDDEPLIAPTLIIGREAIANPEDDALLLAPTIDIRR